MPDIPVTPSVPWTQTPTGQYVINAAGQVATSAANAVIQANMNRKQQQFAVDMYNRQRGDALADYTMQNDYNSPMSQMMRLREAGLNPNMVYNKGADAQGGAVRSASAPGWNPKAPQFEMAGIGQALGSYYDTQLKQAQIDNLKVQNTVSAQQAIKLATETANIAQQTKSGEFYLNKSQMLLNTDLDSARANLYRTQTMTDIDIQRNLREQGMYSGGLQRQAAEILKIKADTASSNTERKRIEQSIELLKKDNIIKELDVKFAKEGMRPTDPIWWRTINSILNKYLNTTGKKEFGGRILHSILPKGDLNAIINGEYIP